MKQQRTLTLATLALAGAWPLSAQTPAPAPAAVSKEQVQAEQDVVELSPFEVTASKDSGYQSTETLAGTRIRTDLKDVASPITVVTKELLQDLGATNNMTLLQYTPSAEVAGTRGTYAGLGNGTSLDESATLRAPQGAQRIRGLASADVTRDFFISDIPWDSYNVDRVDIQRGPNSILFGLGSPAGIVNASINGADFRNHGNATFRVGSYGSARASIGLNQQLIKKVLAIRVDGLWNNEKFQQKPAHSDDKRVSGALRFDPKLFSSDSYHTSIKIKYENGDIKANRPRTLPPYDSITPWFRPIDTTSLSGGMGKFAVDNGYIIGANGTTLSPWLSGVANQQQPLWLIDGGSSQLYQIYGGYVNTGALNAAGVRQGAGTSLVGQRYADVFSSVGTLNGYAQNVKLPNSQYGQYRSASLLDSSVFDFYNNLIDGPNKKEWENWNALNIDVSQTALNDRVGIQITYDRQKYRRGGEALISNPTLSIDILKNFQDYVVGGSNASNPNVGNANYGRPFVSAGPGRGNSYESDRRNFRGSLFAEVRASDLLDRESITAKLLGRHRFTGVYSNEKYQTENLSWQMYANSAAYSQLKLQGNYDGIQNLPPVAVIYLGASLKDATSASGAYIPGIQSNVTLQSGNIYQFESTWKNPTGVNFSDPWNVPTNLQSIFNGNPVINTTTGQPYPQLTQVSNPANYVGWNSNFVDNLLSYNNGADKSLLTAAAKSLRETKSYSGSWQGFLWNDAIVPNLGWRFDEVKSKSYSALPLSGAAARGALNLTPDVYKLPSAFPANQIFKDHSTAGGVVVHLNKLLGHHDSLPFNVSLSYNKSSNFQVTDSRRDIFGTPIANPAGSTKDYGVLLSTKDGKYSFRAVKFETSLSGASTQLDNSGIYGTIRDSLNWRNIKTYYMSAYAWGTAGQTDVTHFTGKRYMWDPAWVNAAGRPVASGSLAQGPTGSHLETQAEADAHRDAALKSINDMQVWLASKGYFTAWNYGVGPTTQAALQTRGEYEASPKQPDPTSVYDYRTAPLMQGFAVTADTLSKGYEFEFTANPLPNWRLILNASETTATRTNVGGPVLDELVGYLDTMMAGSAGDLTRFNSDWSSGNELRQVWNGWRGQYTLLKLQQGASASEIRKWRYNAVTNYSFTHGLLKGAGIGASYRWQDKVVIGYPVVANGSLSSFDLTKPYFGPSEDAIDVWASYERALTAKVSWKIQLNVRNLGKKDGVIPISVQPDGKTWAAVRIAPTQEWFVTNTFSF